MHASAHASWRQGCSGKATRSWCIPCLVPTRSPGMRKRLPEPARRTRPCSPLGRAQARAGAPGVTGARVRSDAGRAAGHDGARRGCAGGGQLHDRPAAGAPRGPSAGRGRRTCAAARGAAAQGGAAPIVAGGRPRRPCREPAACAAAGARSTSLPLPLQHARRPAATALSYCSAGGRRSKRPPAAGVRRAALSEDWLHAPHETAATRSMFGIRARGRAAATRGVSWPQAGRAQSFSSRGVVIPLLNRIKARPAQAHPER